MMRTGGRARIGRVGVVVLVAAVLVGGTVPGFAVAAEDPRFETHVPEPTVSPGQSVTLQVQLENDAAAVDERVDAATDVWATLEAGATNVTVLSGERPVGVLGDGDLRTLSFRIQVPEGIEAGSHDLQLRVEYVDGDDRKTTTVPVTIRVEPRPRFAVVSTATDVPIGGTGTVTVTVENTGEEPATDAALTLQSQAGALAFGQSPSSSRFIGRLAPGETATLEYRMTARPDADPNRYTVQGSVSFVDTDGIERRSRTLRIGVTPYEQTFNLSALSSTLRVGEEGTVRATVTNRGPGPARHAVVRLVSRNSNLIPTETEVALGTLGADESVRVEFPIEVAQGAAGGPRQLSFVIEYRDTEDRLRQSDTLSGIAEVAPERKEFGVRIERGHVEQGGSTTVRILVTNNLNRTVRNVNAKAFLDDPLSSGDDEAFIPVLEPGESATIKIGVAVAGSATPKLHPMKVDFQYELPDGETRLSETYRLPVTVTESDGGGSLLGILPGVLAGIGETLRDPGSLTGLLIVADDVLGTPSRLPVLLGTGLLGGVGGPAAFGAGTGAVLFGIALGTTVGLRRD